MQPRPHWTCCGRWEKQPDGSSRQVGRCALAPDCCIQCGGPGIWRDCSVDDLCMCTECWAASEVASAIRRQEIEAGLLVVRVVVPLWWPDRERNRDRKRRLRQGVVSERQRQLKRTRRFQRGVAQLEDDGEHGRTRSHGC